MVKLDRGIQRLPGDYLFSEVERRVKEFQMTHPDRRVISLGIGDVTLPLPPAVTEAMAGAVREMGTADGFRGYSPCQGYSFLREAISRDYAAAGVKVVPDEIYISDGAKSDCGGLSDLFARDNVVAVCDPSYSVYVDVNAMAGRGGEYDKENGRWSGLVYLPCTPENSFSPAPPEENVDLIYLCSPCNPTGTVLDRGTLQRWVDYANRVGAIILFDGAYETFITSPDIPRSIFEIPGARTCAIELRSFSKTAGFTGVRCAYTVIPDELERGGVKVNALWRRRQSTKFNGVSYITQRGAEAACSPEGRRQAQESIAYYMENARLLRRGAEELGLTVYGGRDAPYLWVETPDGVPSWAFFTRLLEEAGLVTTPGAGFGPSGEGHIRLTAFGSREDTLEALGRLKTVI